MKTSSSGEGCVGSPSRKPSIISGAVSILSSLTMVLLTSLLLVITADTHLELLYLGTGSVGYFVSLQFASG